MDLFCYVIDTISTSKCESFSMGQRSYQRMTGTSQEECDKEMHSLGTLLTFLGQQKEKWDKFNTLPDSSQT
eukprot:12228726-Ditylum_brightwellii.AAC.1